MGPLAGIRIVEFDAIGPVPLCAMLLSDMGADIVRIGRARAKMAYETGNAVIVERGRTTVTLDLKNSDDREKALDLIAHADMLLEGYRPGVMERLGLGPDVCLERSPKLVFGRMTGWGQEGELSARAGHDINYIAIGGALGAMGEPDRPPVPPLNLVGDYGGGAMLLAVGVLAALGEAQRSGKGQVVDAAMTDGTAMLLSLFHELRQNGQWRAERGANLLDGGTPFYRCYACADGKFMSVGALEPQFFAELLDGLGLDPAEYRQADMAGWGRMRAKFEEVFATKTRDEWEAVFSGRDACVAPVLGIEEAVTHSHNRSRTTYVERDGVMQPAPAPRFSRTQSEIGETKTDTVDAAIARWQAGR